jgi:hypothetical protein
MTGADVIDMSFFFEDATPAQRESDSRSTRVTKYFLIDSFS